jgi:ParB-like chromosome segregation protein Spo0J
MTGKPWPADRVERWPLERVKIDPRNTRKHSPAQVDQICRSMLEWGWTSPMLVGEDGTLIAGEGRLAVARKLSSQRN